jgi:hypothetical protein
LDKEITLRRWRVMEIEGRNGIRSRHVWGHDVKNGLGRASSPIVEFDWDAMTATTRSGRNYRLVGLPGNSRLGKHAWKNWCTNNGVVAESDVTHEYLDIDDMSTIELTRINTAAD